MPIMFLQNFLGIQIFNGELIVLISCMSTIFIYHINILKCQIGSMPPRHITQKL
jgi:hypothetical protein